jgi:hypothetical protein
VKKIKGVAPAFALALAASALFVGHIPDTWAQQEPGSRKPACGCYVCGKLIAVTFGEKDCAGILSESACGERLANLPNKEREGFCQKIKAQVRFTSFKDSCPVYAPYCGPKTTDPPGPASGGAASPGQFPPVDGSWEKGTKTTTPGQFPPVDGSWGKGTKTTTPGQFPPVDGSWGKGTNTNTPGQFPPPQAPTSGGTASPAQAAQSATSTAGSKGTGPPGGDRKKLECEGQSGPSWICKTNSMGECICGPRLLH